jgi:ribonuclease HI
VLGGNSWIHGSCSSNEGEALALLESMKELQQRGFSNVIFETDAQNIVGAIRRRNIGVSEFSSIIHKIKCLLIKTYNMPGSSLHLHTIFKIPN